MNANDYMILALAKEKNQGEVLERIKTEGVRAVRLQNGFTGLTDEVGEIASIVKGYVEYGRPLDRIHLIEEVGDALWRLSQIAAAGDFTLETAMRANLEKLNVRYKDRCTDAEANHRNLGAERKILDKMSMEVDHSTTTDADLDDEDGPPLCGGCGMMHGSQTPCPGPQSPISARS